MHHIIAPTDLQVTLASPVAAPSAACHQAPWVMPPRCCTRPLAARWLPHTCEHMLQHSAARCDLATLTRRVSRRSAPTKHPTARPPRPRPPTAVASTLPPMATVPFLASPLPQPTAMRSMSMPRHLHPLASCLPLMTTRSLSHTPPPLSPAPPPPSLSLWQLRYCLLTHHRQQRCPRPRL